MATAVATKPAPPHQKIKRPPPVQTSLNGVKSSQSSPSPSMSSKKPPSGLIQPQTASSGNGSMATMNGGASRTSNRRRDSQRPGDIAGRLVKTGKNGQTEVSDRRLPKRKPEPYVKTAQYILKKYRNASPSLILHLHPTHFRFDQQDGSFSYNSPMKAILQDIKSSTVPHDMMEELIGAGVKFYEGCLIIQVQDHTSISKTSSSTTQASGVEKNIPFSIHNYNEHLTPSPYVPYPSLNTNDSKSKEVKNRIGAETSRPGGQSNESTDKQPSKSPKTFTTVLMPTPMSLHEDVVAHATKLNHRLNGRKHSQSYQSRTPASATLPHPPTPLSGVPSTPSTTGPPAKRQKMLLSEQDIPRFEAAAINATAPPLFLDPVDSLQDSQRVLERLSDPLHSEGYPPPKTRKRTSAELAADEAHATEEQRFMLIMDERLAPTGPANTGGKSGSSDGEAGAASFEPRFERFKILEKIKATHRERSQRMREAQSEQQAQQQVVQAAKARQERHDQEFKRQAHEQKIAENGKREQEMRKLQAAQHATNLAALHQQHHLAASQQAQLSQASSPNGMVPTGAPNSIPISQAHHASPIVRNTTPHSNSSPVVGTPMLGHSGLGVTMNRNTSSQGNASSPARPSSALQQGHPGGGVAMVHQRSQQGPSRRGTPQMSISTPSVQHGTPVMGQATPTPRMGHASPPGSMVQTPTMNQNPIAKHLVGQQLTPQQQSQYLLHQQQQRAYIQHQQQQHQQQQHQQQQHQQQHQHQQHDHQQPHHQHHHQQHHHHHQPLHKQQHQQHQQQIQNPNNIQMSPDRNQMPTPTLQQLATHNQQRQHEMYQQQLRNQQHQQMSGHIIPNGASLPHHTSQPNQPVHLAQTLTSQPQQLTQTQQQQHQRSAMMQQNAILQQAQQKYYQELMRTLTAEHGPHVPEQRVAQAKQQAVTLAGHWFAKQSQARAQAQAQHAQAQAHAHAQVQAQALQQQHAAAQQAAQHQAQQQAMMAARMNQMGPQSMGEMG